MFLQSYVKTEENYIPWMWNMHRRGHRIVKITHVDRKVEVVVELYFQIKKECGVTFKSFSI